MPITRRHLTQFGLLGLAGAGSLALADKHVPAGKSGLNVLILGGTGFLGPHIVEQALAHGHTLTLFNRGKTGHGRFPEVETITGDRNKSLAGLKGRKWDVCIDTSAFSSDAVRRSSKILGPNVGHMVLVSTTAVYSDWSKPGMDENSPVFDPDKKSELGPFERYGANKVACERIAAAAFPERTSVIRSDAIVGPGDHKHHRYTYWVRRATQGGEILGPGDPKTFVQYVDVRDLAAFIVHCAENSVNGTYTATSEGGVYSMANLIADCQTAAGDTSPVTWVDTEFLASQPVRLDFPFWLPVNDPGRGHFNTAAAVAAGLKTTPRLQTAKDTLAYYQSLSPEEQNFQVGVSLEGEAKLLAAWKALQA